MHDEHNSGGVTRRLVFAPGNADCVPFPNMTNNHRGQVAGIPYNNTFVMFLSMRARPCSWYESVPRAGQAGAIGTIWMWTDQTAVISAAHFPRFPNANVVSLCCCSRIQTDGRCNIAGRGPEKTTWENFHGTPEASVTRDRPGTNGGMVMAREVMAGHTVDLFWPGTGPIDPTERSALKEFYRDAMVSVTNYAGYGTGGVGATRAEFLADDSLDPCGGGGDTTTKLNGITCMGGHVVDLYFPRWFVTIWSATAWPQSLGALTHLRSFKYTAMASGNQNGVIVMPGSVSNWAQLLSFHWCDYAPTTDQLLTLPSTMGDLSKLKALELLNAKTTPNTFPNAVFAIPAMMSMLLNKVALNSLPAVSSMGKLEEFHLLSTGLSGPAPTFKGLSKLRSLSLLGNKLTGGTQDMFDDCGSLTSFNINSNNLNCQMFDLVGCTNLTSIHASKNALVSLHKY
jgi:hypothetical protein